MKKFIVTITCGLFLSVTPVIAQSPTLSPTTTASDETVTEKLSDQISNLKEKIASRVAQLKLVEKRGILGTVKDVSATQLSLTDIHGKTRIVDVDEITKFSSPSAKDSFGISDLKSGSKVSVIGLYNKDSERLLARFVDAISLPILITGTVSSIDSDNFSVTVAREDGMSYIVDIETVTKTTMYDDTEGEKSGFSKIEEGNRLVITGFPDKKEKNRMVATRILLFPGLPKNPDVVVAPNAVKPNEAVTSSGSGKKLTPLTQ